jgi:hypothetical protein
MDFTFIGNEVFVPYDEALDIKNKIVSIIQEQTAHLTPATVTA